MTSRLVGWIGDRRVEAALGDVVRLGASPDNEFRVETSDVSARHARVLRLDDAFWIEDLGSGGGTFINGERVEKSRLHHLDVITLGRATDLVFIEQDASGESMTIRPGAAAAATNVNVDVEWKTNLYASEELRGGAVPEVLRAAGAPEENTAHLQPGAIQFPTAFRKDEQPAPEAKTSFTSPGGRYQIPTNIQKIASDGATLPPETVLGFREVGPPPSVLGRSRVLPDREADDRPTPPPMSAALAPIADREAGPRRTTGPLVGMRLTGNMGDFRLPLGRSSIGRSLDATVRIDSREVSRVHAYVVVTPADAKVEDNGSSNGTSVNGRTIGEPRTLVEGDRLAIGTFEFRVELLRMEGAE
jgi:pSer/pThr/pTyr-binding forkhead associated (FHA) protein